MIMFLIKQCESLALSGYFAADRKVVLNRFAELSGQLFTGNEFSEAI